MKPTYHDGGWAQYCGDHDLPLEDPGGNDVDQEPEPSTEDEPCLYSLDDKTNLLSSVTPPAPAAQSAS